MIGPPLEPPRTPTLLDALTQLAATGEGATFVDLREPEERVAWAELAARGRRVAAALASRGVAPGDRVALVFPTGPEFFVAFFGAWLAGAVPVPLYPPLRLGRLDEYHAQTARMLGRVEAKLVLGEARVRRLLGESMAAARPALGCRTLAELVDGRTDELARPARPDELALIQFSSGTTVAPKPVALTHANLVAQCQALYQLMPATVKAPQRGVFWLPLYHDMGLVGALSGVYYPGEVALLPPDQFLTRPSLWLRAISRFRGTISTAPSFAYALCVERVRDEELDGVDLSSWRHALDGAESVSAEVCRRFAERFARWGFDARALTPVYGMSEATLALAFTPPRRGPRVLSVDAVELARSGRVRPGTREVVSVGVPVPGVAVEVRDRSGRPLDGGRVGRVYARGPAVTGGYFRDPAGSRLALRGGWLDTGDLGFVDGGELFVCGRAKDVIVIRGANHAPEEIEQPLDGIAGVRRGCAVALGLPTARGEDLLIVVERDRHATRSDPAIASEVIARVVEHTGLRPHRVEVVAPGTIPRTSSGKKRRAETLRRLLTGELAPPRPVGKLAIALALARSALAFARLRARRA